METKIHFTGKLMYMKEHAAAFIISNTSAAGGVQVADADLTLELHFK